MQMSSFSAVKVQVPEGLEQVLYDLSREILRDQPSNIHAYAAAHFAGKLKNRSCLINIDFIHKFRK